jgi:flagellar protein FliT
MADAARAGDWEKLTGLEERCSALVSQLKSALPAKLDRETQLQKAELIRKILADDAEIRAHTEPWMTNLRKFLGDARQERNVRQAP